MAETKGLVSRRFLDMMLILQVVLNIIVLGLIIAFMILGAKRISDINQNQLDAVTTQNAQQLCNQHDMVQAVRLIGEKLNLPVEDIVPPPIGDIDCPKLRG